MKFLPFKVAMSVDKTRLQPSRDNFVFLTDANQIGQAPSMFQVCVLVGYYLGWVKPGERTEQVAPTPWRSFGGAIFLLSDARVDVPLVKIEIIISREPWGSRD
jgi:hypothetical protein